MKDIVGRSSKSGYSKIKLIKDRRLLYFALLQQPIHLLPDSFSFGIFFFLAFHF